MDAGTVVAIVSFGTANAVAFGVTLIKIGRLNERFDLVWSWWLKHYGPDATHNRRHDDPGRVAADADRQRELELARLHADSRHRL